MGKGEAGSFGCKRPLTNASTECNGTLWNSSVAPEIPSPQPEPNRMAPILTDIGGCNLPNVSWVIPDGSWSDHAGYSDDKTPPGDYGPSWVAAIVNAVGQSSNCDGFQNGYWHDTVIIVVWDDWGGWYDHVLPWRCDGSGKCTGYPNNGGGQQYVYGFRVPMLVVSAYNNHGTGSFTGYVSGACQSPGN